MTDIKQKKENVKMHLKDLRQNLKKMHLEVTEELLIPQPEDVKKLMNKMDQLLKKIESLSSNSGNSFLHLSLNSLIISSSKGIS